MIFGCEKIGLINCKQLGKIKKKSNQKFSLSKKPFFLLLGRTFDCTVDCTVDPDNLVVWALCIAGTDFGSGIYHPDTGHTAVQKRSQSRQQVRSAITRAPKKKFITNHKMIQKMNQKKIKK